MVPFIKCLHELVLSFAKVRDTVISLYHNIRERRFTVYLGRIERIAKTKSLANRLYRTVIEHRIACALVLLK